ncbi:MAG: hypothetical protein H6622_06175 [Halobacteriovoraceae bacterium]|nr:hypothetical protein [Halobacteriovoraceae bacterium]
MKILIHSILLSLIFINITSANENWIILKQKSKNHLLDDRQKILKRIWKHPYTQELWSTSYDRYELFLRNHDANIEDAEGFYEYLMDLKYKKTFYDLIYLGIHNEDIIDLIFVINESTSKEDIKKFQNVLRNQALEAALNKFQVSRELLPKIELQLLLGNGLSNHKDMDRLHKSQKEGKSINPRLLSEEGFSALLLEIFFNAPKEIQDFHINKFINDFARNKELTMKFDIIPHTYDQFVEIIELMELIPFNMKMSRIDMFNYNLMKILSHEKVDWQKLLKNFLAQDYFSYEVFEREISKVQDARSSRNLRRKLHIRESGHGIKKIFYVCQKLLLKKFTL